jgi:hypothetical protein
MASRQLDAAAQLNPEAGADGLITIPVIAQLSGHTGNDWSTDSPEARLRFYALEVNGRTLLVYMEATPDEFETFAQELEQILAGVEFAGP